MDAPEEKGLFPRRGAPARAHTELADPLPKTAADGTDAVPAELPGAVALQLVRCGKPSCRCASGDRADLHGPYPYRFWREGGRLRKAYVRRGDLGATLAACERRRGRDRADRERRRGLHALLREFRTTAADVERALAEWRRAGT